MTDATVPTTDARYAHHERAGRAAGEAEADPGTAGGRVAPTGSRYWEAEAKPGTAGGRVAVGPRRRGHATTGQRPAMSRTYSWRSTPRAGRCGSMGTLSWNSGELTCAKLDRATGGRGRLPFRGTLAHRPAARAGVIPRSTAVDRVGRRRPHRERAAASHRAASPAAEIHGGGDSAALSAGPAAAANWAGCGVDLGRWFVRQPWMVTDFSFARECAIPRASKNQVTVASLKLRNRAGLIVPSSLSSCSR